MLSLILGAAALLALALIQSPTPTPGPLQTALAAARAFSGMNADWQALYPDGFIHTFDDGVPMVLVPVGCFQMGSEDASDDEQPVHEQCFNAPFWIDQTEVTQADFKRLGGLKAEANRFPGDRRPVERITYFEARDFCALRNARLPTEREWEYAARGPDALVYPWGNTWNQDSVVWNRGETASVGSLPAGRSWVGALDLIGNLWEWTDSQYRAYVTGDELYVAETSDIFMVLRGGSWLDSMPSLLRAANRVWFLPDNQGNSLGFRCARSA